MGKKTQVFLKKGKKEDEDKCLSIVTKERTLDIAAFDKAARNLIFTGIQLCPGISPDLKVDGELDIDLA